MVDFNQFLKQAQLMQKKNARIEGTDG